MITKEEDRDGVDAEARASAHYRMGELETLLKAFKTLPRSSSLESGAEGTDRKLRDKKSDPDNVCLDHVKPDNDPDEEWN